MATFDFCWGGLPATLDSYLLNGSAVVHGVCHGPIWHFYREYPFLYPADYKDFAEVNSCHRFDFGMVKVGSILICRYPNQVEYSGIFPLLSFLIFMPLVAILSFSNFILIIIEFVFHLPLPPIINLSSPHSLATWESIPSHTY